MLEKVIRIYFENSPKLLQTMRDAVAEDQTAETVERAAHSLKSSSACLGATRLASLCGNLEEMARKNRTRGTNMVISSSKRTN